MKNQLTLISMDKESIEKCRVRLNPSTRNWEVIFPLGRKEEYTGSDAVIFAVSKYFERKIRFKKAEEIIFRLNTYLLSIKEMALVRSISDSGKCTKRQYGYLKGIWERQQ